MHVRQLLIPLAFLVSTLAAPTASAQDYVSTADDIALAEIVLRELADAPQQAPGAQMVLAAKRLLGQPYEAGTQEGREERLRIYLTRTDCILFAETCLGLVRTVQRCGAGASFEDLAATLQQTRYRDGVVDGYPSRLHYTTEWIDQGVRTGVFENVSEDWDNVCSVRPVNFMSTHPDSYAPLKGASPTAQENLRRIREMEARVSALPRCYLPKDRLARFEDRIQDGDIICFATSSDGLDYSHVVIAYREKPGDRLGFIHASTAAKKVVVEPRTLEAYLQANGRIVGISVLRVRE